jgi:hypothetical protein
MREEVRSVRRYAFCMHATAIGCTSADSAIVARDALRGWLCALSRTSGRVAAVRAASPGEGEGRGAPPRPGRSCQCSYLQYLVVAKVWPAFGRTTQSCTRVYSAGSVQIGVWRHSCHRQWRCFQFWAEPLRCKSDVVHRVPRLACYHLTRAQQANTHAMPSGVERKETFFRALAAPLASVECVSCVALPLCMAATCALRTIGRT